MFVDSSTCLSMGLEPREFWNFNSSSGISGALWWWYAHLSRVNTAHLIDFGFGYLITKPGWNKHSTQKLKIKRKYLQSL